MRNRSRVPVVVGMALVGLLLSAAALAQTYWFESYERAVQLIDKGKPEAAAPLLRSLLEERPLPQAYFKVPGNRYVTYLPYFQEARIEFSRGNLDAAARHLDIEEAFGAVLENSASRREFLELRDRIAQAQDEGTASVRLR